jgi:hypothetical protein
MRTKLTPAFVQKARAEHKAGLSPGESHLDDVVEAAAEKLRKALAAKSAAKLRGDIERIAQGLDDVLLARRERAGVERVRLTVL